jgi:hypothetical protein
MSNKDLDIFKEDSDDDDHPALAKAKLILKQ